MNVEMELTYLVFSVVPVSLFLWIAAQIG